MLEFQTYQKDQSGIKIALYGESGTGKTRSCSTAPNWLFVSSEEKFASIKQALLQYIRVLSIAELKSVMEELQVTYSPGSITICIDSMTDIAERTLRSGFMKKDMRQEYFEVQNQCEDFFRWLRSYPFDVIVVFKAKLQRDNANTMKYYPSLPGSAISSNIPYFFDYTFATRCFKDEQRPEAIYSIQTHGDGQYIANDSSDRLKMFEVPNFSYIFNIIKAPESYDNPPF